MKRVFLIHRWEGKPDDVWFPWLKQELEKRGFEVFAPAMPDTDEPRIEAWVPALSQAVGEVDAETILVGHSIGCQTIARYLDGLPDEKKVRGVLFVAGFVTLTGLETKEVEEIARPWLEIPIDWEDVKKKADKFTAIFSDNDPYVPLSNAEFFKEKVGAEIIIEHNKGHFSDGTTELPSALNAVLKMSGDN